MTKDAPTTEKKEDTVEKVKDTSSIASEAKKSDTKKSTGFQGKKNAFQRRPKRPARKIQKDEFEQKIIDIRRVTRVVAGGRRFSFSVAMVVGNKKGTIGVGLGKASDTSLAIEKAARVARKNAIQLDLTENRSIPRQTQAKYCASYVSMRPAFGRGLIAGSSVRNILDLGGITDVNAKILSRSKNKLNNAQAAMKALKAFEKK